MAYFNPHMSQEIPLCRNITSPLGCRFGNHCRFSHLNSHPLIFSEEAYNYNDDYDEEFEEHLALDALSAAQGPLMRTEDDSPPVSEYDSDEESIPVSEYDSDGESLPVSDNDSEDFGDKEMNEVYQLNMREIDLASSRVAAPVAASVHSTVTAPAPVVSRVAALLAALAPAHLPSRVAAPLPSRVAAPAAAPAVALVTAPLPSRVASPLASHVTAPLSAPVSAPAAASVAAPVTSHVASRVAAPAAASVASCVAVPVAAVDPGAGWVGGTCYLGRHCRVNGQHRLDKFHAN
jgi:hypothetical protein